jgi:hypothetical protein
MDIMCVYVLVSASCVVRKSLLNFLEFISSLLEIAGGCLARPPKKFVVLHYLLVVLLFTQIFIDRRKL